MSEHEPVQTPWNFLGLPEELSAASRARCWVLPIPYEGTTSYGAGARDGPAAIIAASRQVEWFDREFGCEPVTQFGIHTMVPLGLVHRSPESMVQAIEMAVASTLSGAPAPSVLAVLGGEHTVSVGVVRGLVRAQGAKELVAVQIDAHADLRDEYEGSPYSHACAGRRIVESCPLFQIGIRNLSAGEDEFRRQSDRVTTFFAEASLDGSELLEAIGHFVRGKQVFLTIDLDGLDPSIMPSVGTPEPGGLSWARTLEIVGTVCREAAGVPVFDVVELAPIPGFRGPDFLAAKLVYKLFSLLLTAPARK